MHEVLLGLRVLGLAGVQTVAGEVPSGTHCIYPDITLRVLEERAGKRTGALVRTAVPL